MKPNQKCPDCRQWLERNSDECYCGWRSVLSKTHEVADHRCVYQSAGRRCPLTGTKTYSTHHNSPWYCLEHYRNLKDPKRSYEILIDAENNFESIMDEYIDWRVKLNPEEYSAKKAQIRKIYELIKKQ